MEANTEPKLAPPGAGQPAFELAVGRIMFALKRATGNRQSFTEHFEYERARIQQLVRGLDAESAARRVLITRLRGLEDSSRYWSVWMTLDHLRIVNGSMIRVIGALTKGVVPPGKASTANVKPSLRANATVVAEFEKSCDDLLTTVAARDNLKTPQRYKHPWLGSLNAAGWHAMAGTHMTIHRRQIEQIIKGLA